ncbi:MAG: methionyl-tRNA formyltransferase, partial [Anaerolineales bacterium]
AGRGKQMQPPPVKLRAIQLSLPIHQPSSLRERAVQDLIRQLSPEMIVVAAYGKILPQAILTIPPLGCINVHASLLPRWRGASPIQSAILAGDTRTGISIIRMEQGLDTGPIYLQESLDILANENSGELSKRLSILGAEMLVRAIPEIQSGRLSAQAQDEKLTSHAPILKKADGQLDFNQPASRLALQVRAFEPWPSSYFLWNDSRIVVREAYAVDTNDQSPGTLLEYNHYPAVSASPGLLVLSALQPAGKKLMSGDTFLNGAKDFRDGRITHTTKAGS